MFRRKEENLFDTNTDPNYAQDISGDLSASVVPPTATNTSANGSSGAANGSSGSGSMGGLPPSGNSSHRATGDSRPASNTQAAPTTNFRPNSAPINNELTRNRLPDTKPASVSTTGIDKTVKAGRRVLTVGNDILLKGEIATCDRLVIEGKVDATLNDVHTVEISETGSFKGSAQIEDAEISGLFEGDLVVRNRLVIYATGKVRGKITYGEIEIERGGELTGEIKTVAAVSQPNTRPTRPVKETVTA